MKAIQKRLRVRSIVLAIALALVAGCVLPTESESLLTDVALARERWLASPPQDYSFTIELYCFCFGAPRRVHVAGGSVVATEDTTGTPVAIFPFTLDTLWGRILRARPVDIVSVAFDQRGVPVHAEIGLLANDSGIRYTVRNFVRTR